MARLELTAAALKQLRKMPARDREALLEKLSGYAATGQGDVKKLKGSDFYRLRHGDWRAVFDQDRQLILVIEIAHRREIYR